MALKRRSEDETKPRHVLDFVPFLKTNSGHKKINWMHIVEILLGAIIISLASSYITVREMKADLVGIWRAIDQNTRAIYLWKAIDQNTKDIESLREKDTPREKIK